MSSLRRQLLVALLGVLLLGSLAGAYATYRSALAEIGAVFDYDLRQLALSVRDLAIGVASELPAPDPDFDYIIQVWDRNGARLFYSRPHVDPPSRVQAGFATVETREGRWRVYGLLLQNQAIQVAHPLAVRETLAARAAFGTLAPFLLMLPLLGMLVWWLTGRALRPLRRLAAAVTRRRADSLEPVELSGAPAEALPLVTALNGLLERLGTALRRQRDFTADAAHELRSPLTALSLQVQLLERAPDAAARTLALAELREGIARATHLVEQLLGLSRQGPDALPPRERLVLAELAAEVVADHASLAEARGIDLGMTAADTALRLDGEREGLRLLLANLIGNALRYTPQGGRVDVAVHAAGGGACIEVVDNGPGIPPHERERVFDRFYRRAGQEQPGSGLGLSIVRAVAERHGAQVRLLDAPGGGLLVQVVFAPGVNPAA